MSGYKSYPAYKDSGVEWLGDIPTIWKSSRLKYDVVLKARVGWHGLKSDEFTDEGPYLVTGTDFGNHTIKWDKCAHCTEDRFAQDRFIQLKNGDLLVTKDGTIGKTAIVTGLTRKACLNSGIFVARPIGESCIQRYLYWLINSSVFTDFVRYFQTGSTINHLYQETFEQFAYPLPPSVDEQAQIAAFLDHETAKIDRLIEKQEKLIELLKEKRQAVISHAVTKGLDPNAPMKDSGAEWLGEIPAHWEFTRVKLLCSFITSGPRGWSDFITDEGELFLQSGDLNDELGIDYSSAKRVDAPVGAECERTVLHESDVLVCITGAKTGRVAVARRVPEKAYINQHLSLIRPRTELVSARYLGLSLGSTPGQSYFEISQYGLKQGLSLENVAEAPALLPPLSEQRDIVDHILSHTEKMQKLLGVADKKIKLLQERRTSLISAAVTGKIDVRDWAG